MPLPKRFCVLAALPVVLPFLAGCAGFAPQPGPGPTPSSTQAVPLTQPVLLLGDTQEHEATGYPLLQNDSAVDAYVEVAQRPPEQPLFGRWVLEQALRQGTAMPYIHLGDVMDLSCQSEARRIVQLLVRSPQPGAVLPGNHDGLMFGIYGYRLLEASIDPDAQRWQRACRRPGASDELQALDKRGFLRLYLRAQADGHLKGLDVPELAERGEQRLQWTNPDPKAFVSAMRMRLADTPFDKSFGNATFLTQRLLLPAAPGAPLGVVVIGLDTNQAGPVSTFWDVVSGKSPGSMGHVRDDQLADVQPWLDEARRAGQIVVFAGHHNWRSLSLASRLRLRAVMERLDHPLLYLSAHTHRGFWAEHRELARRPVLELNTSSLSDWPVAMRQLSLAWDASARRLFVRGALMPLRPDGQSAQSDAELLAAWEAQTCSITGLPMSRLRSEDLALVREQRERRGGLFDWAVAALSPLCERCQSPLFEHAQSYQDEMLSALLQLDDDLGVDAAVLRTLPSPPQCQGQAWTACARRLRSTVAEGFEAQTALFRDKADLVRRLSDALEDLDGSRATAYMACRAVQAAQLDFELTPDERNSHRGEAKRRAEQFFRIEASVGMD